VHVISRKRLREFWTQRPHRAAEAPLQQWSKTVSKAAWGNLAEVREVYPHADPVGNCTVFNIGGNKYRLVTKIFYKQQTVLVRAVLTHREYDEEGWKDDCNC
jgi:mRNA interferase HigB